MAPFQQARETCRWRIASRHRERLVNLSRQLGERLLGLSCMFSAGSDPGFSIERERVRDRWFVVKSLPRKEFLAEQHLLRQGFETFLPLITAAATTITGLGAARRSAFFPSYLFVHLNLDVDRWRSVNGTIGVSNLLHVGGKPTPAPRGLVEQLISLTNEVGELGFGDTLQNGRSVRVVGGPFDRMLGTFEGLDGAGRARVLLEMMGRPVSVSLPRGSVMAV